MNNTQERAEALLEKYYGSKPDDSVEANNLKDLVEFVVEQEVQRGSAKLIKLITQCMWYQDTGEVIPFSEIEDAEYHDRLHYKLKFDNFMDLVLEAEEINNNG
jgi:hypothetical protein